MNAGIRKSLASAAALLVGLSLSGCPQKQVKKTAQPSAYASPQLEFRGIGFENRSFAGMKTVFKFSLISQDERPAQVQKCAYGLELSDREAIEGQAKSEASLPGQGKILVSAKVAIPWPEGHDAVQAFLARKRWPYKFKLKCQLTGPDGPITAAGSDGGSIPLPKLPQMDVTQANAERFGTGDETRINFELSMLNENTFKLRLDKIVYKVFLGDIEVTAGDLPLAEVIPASSEFTYDVATPIFNERDNKEVIQLLKQSQIEYRLEGTIYLSGFELPLDAKGTINFTRGDLE